MNIFKIFFILQIKFYLLKSQKLISVFTLNRHGARAPIKLDNNSNDYFGNFWPNKGKLTPYGERMLYILGIYLRYKYLNNETFLNKTCDPHDIYFFSSDFDRTILSAQSEILGLCSNTFNYKVIDKNLVNLTYPPLSFLDDMKSEINKLNNEKFSLPNSINLLPIHISNEDEGKFLITMASKCKKVYKKLLKHNLENNKILLEEEKKFNDLYKSKLNKLHNENKYYKFDEMFYITDQYMTSLYDGRNINEILIKNNINPDDFFKIANKIHYYYILYLAFGDEKGEGYKLEVSLLLKDIINHFKNIVHSDIIGNDKLRLNFTNQKFMIGIAHDSTIMGIQLFINDAFKFYDNIYTNVIDITYAGSMTFELYRDKKNKKILDPSNYYIDYFINEKFIKRFSFNNFINTINNFMWDEEKINEYCSVENYVLQREVTILKNIILVLIGIIVICVFLLYNNKKKVYLRRGSRKDSKKEKFIPKV